MPSPSPISYLSLRSVAALGIGSMVGAGIFALMGQAVLMAGDGVYYSFIIGGIAALLSGYSYSKLGSKYPSSGGIMDYFDTAFTNKTFSGTLSIIYLITLAITCTLIAKAFGAYASRLLFPESALPFWSVPLFSSLIIILLGLMNMSGAGLVGKAEVALVAFKLFILSILIIAGLDNIASPSTIQEGQAITTLTKIDWTTTFGSVGLTFFAYAGYGMMANTAGNLKNPQKTLPRAIFFAIGIVILLYVALSFIVLKNVPTSELKTHVDTAVAQTARPLLGKWGDIAVSIAALVASASAINATMFSFLRISQGLAAKNQLDTAFKTPLWRQGSKGFVLTLGGILIITNLFNLAAIANIASTTFLICYLAVFVAHWKLRQETRTNGAPIIIGFLLMLGILIAFLRQIYVTQAPALVVIVLFIIVSFILERWIRKSSKRAMKHIPPPSV